MNEREKMAVVCGDKTSFSEVPPKAEVDEHFNFADVVSL